MRTALITGSPNIYELRITSSDAPAASAAAIPAGAEIDLLLEIPGAGLWSIEVKRSLSPKLARGFHAACEDLQPTARWVVYPGTGRYPAGAGIEVVSLPELAGLLVALGA